MKKLNLLRAISMLLFSVFILYGCRSEENALEKSNPNTEYKIIHQNYSLVQKNNNLNQKFTVLENIANTNKKKSAKQNSENIIEIDGIKIFKDYVTYVSPINSSKETYSFYVENSNYRLAPNTVQNLVFSKKENETDYSAYLVTYTFPEGINNDNKNIKISKIEKLNISSFFSKKSNTVNTKLAAKTSSDCLISYTYDIIETKHACSANKHYGDSEISECTADIKPYSTYVMKITSMYADCGTESWGTPESGSSAPGGGSGSTSGSTAPSVDTSISLPPTCQTGDCNEEILANKINTSLEMPLDYYELLWLNSNTDFAEGIWNMLSNNSSTETKNFAQWGITFASNNNISWTQFQNWFIEDAPDGFFTEVINYDTKTILDVEILNSPEFKMRKLDQIKYPRFTLLLKTLRSKVEQNPTMLNRLSTLSGLTNAQVLEKLTFGKGPLINIVPNLMGPSGPNYGNFDSEIPNQININANFVLGLEKSVLNTTIEATAFLLAVTVLHEFIHYGNHLTGYNTQGQEMGNLFEIDSYGIIITKYNASQYIISLKNK